MKRALVIAAIVLALFVAVLLHTPIKDWLWTHPWWHSFFVAVPVIAAAVIAWVELSHSAEANVLRREANTLRRELDDERNKHLEDIAAHMKPQLTQADRNAAKARKYIGQVVSVSEGKGMWPSGVLIAEVNDDNIATLFSPMGAAGTRAWAVQVHCNDLEIVDMTNPVQVSILKRYGPTIELGNIRKWEERGNPAEVVAIPEKGHMAYYATYGKSGSSETRDLHVYAAKDGSNRFVLEAKPGGTFTGDNVDISKRFMILQVQFEAEGFTHVRSGSGGSQHRLYIKAN